MHWIQACASFDRVSFRVKSYACSLYYFLQETLLLFLTMLQWYVVLLPTANSIAFQPIKINCSEDLIPLPGHFYCINFSIDLNFSGQMVYTKRKKIHKTQMHHDYHYYNLLRCSLAAKNCRRLIYHYRKVSSCILDNKSLFCLSSFS